VPRKALIARVRETQRVQRRKRDASVRTHDVAVDNQGESHLRGQGVLGHSLPQKPANTSALSAERSRQQRKLEKADMEIDDGDMEVQHDDVSTFTRELE